MTLGDPRGIGPEIVAATLADPGVAGRARFVVLGPDGALPAGEAGHAASERLESVGRWAAGGSEAEAGRLAAASVERGIALCLEGHADGLVTAPLSKAALHAAGYPWPGHTELLRDRCAVPDVTMIMSSEHTPIGGALRLALLTVHVPLRDVPSMLTVDLVVRRAGIAVRALRDWWGIERPRLAFAGVNPHASEGGLFGDEESRVLDPAARRIEEDGVAEVTGIFPADTVFRHCLSGDVDAVVVPYHDVGLAVLKTLASESGINVTAGLPFPRTSPDHGTAFDIAGRGVADPGSMKEATVRCLEFASRARDSVDPPGRSDGD